MAESIVTVVIHVVGVVAERYERNGTARGIYKQADDLLAEARKNLYQELDLEDIAEIEESLENHPELDTLDTLKARYKRALFTHRLHKDQLNHASRMDRAWAFSELAQSIRSELEDVRELDQDITATTACPARSVANLLDVPKPKRESRRSKVRASLHKLAKLGKFARDIDPACASADPQITLNCISVQEEAEESSLDLSEIQETLDQLSKLVVTGGEDFEQQVDEVLVHFSPRLSSSSSLVLPNDETSLVKSAPMFESLLDAHAGIKRVDL